MAITTRALGYVSSLVQGQAGKEVIAYRLLMLNAKAVLAELLACPVPISLAVMSFKGNSRLPWQHIDQRGASLFSFNIQPERQVLSIAAIVLQRPARRSSPRARRACPNSNVDILRRQLPVHRPDIC